jgi:hypothetical protein
MCGDARFFGNSARLNVCIFRHVNLSEKAIPYDYNLSVNMPESVNTSECGEKPESVNTA